MVAVSETPEELSRTTREQKQGMLQHFKREFDRCRKNLFDPPVYLVRLPDAPLLLLRDYDVLYRSFYKDGAEPCPPPVDPRLIHELDSSYCCRGGQVARPQVTAPAVAQTLDVGSPISPMASMERVANIFMDRLGSLQSSQQKLIEIMITGNASSGQHQSLNLNASADMAPPQLRRTPTRRQPTITFSSAGLADDRVASANDSEPALAVVPAALPSSSASALPGPQVASSAALADATQEEIEQGEDEMEQDEQRPEESRHAKLESMLDMLQEREVESRKRAKSSKASKAEERAEDAASNAKPAGRGRGRGACKGRGKGASNSKGTLTTGEAGEQVKAAAGQIQPKAIGEGAGKGRGTGVPKGKAKGKAKAKPAGKSEFFSQGDAVPVLPVRFGPKEISHEKSRNQYLARTGLRGAGQSKSFSYGPNGRLSAWPSRSPTFLRPTTR